MYFLPSYRRGIFNRYRKGMPVFEMLLKDLSVMLQTVWTLLQGRRVKRILVYPHFPSRGSTIYRIAKKLGYEVTNKMVRKFDAVMYWEYATVRTEYEKLESLQAVRHMEVINLHNRNISKDQVDAWMQEAFGYCTRLDPRNYEGIAVRKSTTNAVHDGTKVTCPCKPEPGFIYQKFIDSSVNSYEVMDLRIPVMKKEIPHLYRNYRENDQRFKNVPYRAELETDIFKHLCEKEQEQILKFCALAGMDYGELDVLRDCHDHRLYIVDANNTPQGPPKKLSKEEKEMSIRSYAACFKRNFL